VVFFEHRLPETKKPASLAEKSVLVKVLAGQNQPHPPLAGVVVVGIGSIQHMEYGR
jgi:hypothetical protein